MFVGRKAEVFCGFNIPMPVVHGVGSAIKQLGNCFGLAGRLNTVLRDAEFVLFDLSSPSLEASNHPSILNHLKVSCGRSQIVG